jgi:hypothetical protein
LFYIHRPRPIQHHPYFDILIATFLNAILLYCRIEIWHLACTKTIIIIIIGIIIIIIIIITTTATINPQYATPKTMDKEAHAQSKHAHTKREIINEFQADIDEKCWRVLVS